MAAAGVAHSAESLQDVMKRRSLSQQDLLAAAKAPASGYGCLSSTGVHFVSDDRDDCLAESRRDGSLVVELVQRPVRIIALMDGAVRN